MSRESERRASWSCHTCPTLACMASFRQHLSDKGKMLVHIDHQDGAWLGGLPIEPEGAFGDPSELRLPDGRAFRTRKRWSYDRATQTAALVTRIEQTDSTGAALDGATRGPVRMHCFFRYEMEHFWKGPAFGCRPCTGIFRAAASHVNQPK